MMTIAEKKEPLPTLCLNMIVRNESAIICRLFDSVLSIIDCYCICDTGSTDNTIQVITEYFTQKGIPGKIIKDPFKNFAYSRNVALDACREMSDYILLLDADMILNIIDFDKASLSLADSFQILQGNEHFFYYNRRIVRNNGSYRYIGVTHEVIVGSSKSEKLNSLNKEQLFILDIGDGGSKSNKFERDIDLLKKGIIDEPLNKSRYYFYLANSYFDTGKNTEAIETYQERIKLGGWIQEVWMSYYKIGMCYTRMGQHEKATHAWLEGYEQFPDRIENLYEITTYFRKNGKYKTAFEFYKIAKNILDKKLRWYDYLFLQNDVYTYKLAFEYTVIAYYIGHKNINNEVISILNNCDNKYTINTLLSNMKFYKDTLVFKTKSNDTNTSVQPISEKISLNRFSNLPKMFNHFKEDTIVGVNYKNELWTISSINYENESYHVFAVFENTKLLRYSSPFKFTTLDESSETCVTFSLDDIEVSCHILTPKKGETVITYDKSYIEEKLMYN
jgi:tetratricopeptide (TPR) repeat protein